MIIVPGRPADTALTWWVGTDAGSTPELALAGPGSSNAPVFLQAIDAATPPGALSPFLVGAKGLTPDCEYTLRARIGGGAWTEGRSRTLPQGHPAGKPFTISLGSCYCPSEDKGIGEFYPPGLHDSPEDPVRLRILCGDQLYMDLRPDTGGVIVKDEPNPWLRYTDHWRLEKFAKFLAKSPTLMMADDHEFWNDYPHSNAWLLWDERGNAGRLAKTMDEAFRAFQLPLNLDPQGFPYSQTSLRSALQSAARTFQLNAGPLNLFVLDTRTRRSLYDADGSHFADPTLMGQALSWVKDLKGPGFLLVSQPMVETKAGWLARMTHTMGDVNLPDYFDDFAALWNAVLEAPHQVVVLTGDIHWCRIYLVSKARPNLPVVEVVSSPLSLIPPVIPISLGGGGHKKENGKVDWEGGSASWLRATSSDLAQAYATLSLTPLTEAAEGPLKLEVRYWTLPSGGQSDAQQIGETFSFMLN
jgi:PhoD-like phosphatase